MDGTPNHRNKAAFSWRISVDGSPNRRNKAPFSWRISVDGRPNRRNKAPSRDGLVWTVGLTGEIKLPFHISLVLCGHCLIYPPFLMGILGIVIAFVERSS